MNDAMMLITTLAVCPKNEKNLGMEFFTVSVNSVLLR